MTKLLLSLAVLCVIPLVTVFFQRDTLFGADELRIDTLETTLETFKTTNGRYVQVLPGSQLPHYETGTIEEKLGKKLPDGVRVDIYTTPDGTQGFQVTQEEMRVDGMYKRSFGRGPEAKSRSYDWSFIYAATSTP